MELLRSACYQGPQWNHLLSSSTTTTQSECVSVVLANQQTKLMHCIIPSSVAGLVVSYFSIQFHKQHSFHEKYI